MEVCWDIVHYTGFIAEMLGMGYILYCFVKPFVENKKAAACAGAAYSVMMLALYFVPFSISINNFAAYSIGVFCAFSAMCRMDRRNYRQKLFLAVTFFSLRWLSVYMAGILLENAYQLFITAYQPKSERILFYAYIADVIADAAAGFALIGISVKCITKAYVYKRENMSAKELFMLAAPSVMSMTGYGIMQYYQAYFSVNTVQVNTGIYHGLAFAHYGISIVTIVVVTVLFQSMKARQEEKLHSELLAAQIASIQQHIAQVEILYENIRSIRHDMTNHILTLERLYDADQAEEARAYGTELKHALSGLSGEIKSGNPVTDVILQEAGNEAEKRNIRFDSGFYYPQGQEVNAFDISVILHNALQNALEHALESRMPYITIYSYRRNNAYMIEIISSFAGTLKWDMEKGLPVTSKRRADGHGYGLANIRRVAEKYSGAIDIVLKDGEFRLSVLLMLDRVQE